MATTSGNTTQVSATPLAAGTPSPGAPAEDLFGFDESAVLTPGARRSHSASRHQRDSKVTTREPQ